MKMNCYCNCIASNNIRAHLPPSVYHTRHDPRSHHPNLTAVLYPVRYLLLHGRGKSRLPGLNDSTIPHTTTNPPPIPRDSHNTARLANQAVTAAGACSLFSLPPSRPPFLYKPLFTTRETESRHTTPDKAHHRLRVAGASIRPPPPCSTKTPLLLSCRAYNSNTRRRSFRTCDPR